MTVPDLSSHDAVLDAIVNGAPQERMAAWREAYVQHRSKMFAAAFKKCSNRDDASDAVQQAFSEIMTSDPATLSGVRRLGGYLARAASNRAVDIIRKNERSDPTDPDDLGDAGDGELDPADRVVYETALEHGLAILDEMPEEVRYAYVQRVLFARPAKDVAAERGYKPQYVSQLVSKAVAFIDEHSAFIDRGNTDLVAPATSPGETKDA